MKLVKNVNELRDLAIVYLTRANGSVHDAIGDFEKALFDTSPVLAALYAGPNESLRIQIALYLDGIQSELAYLFQEGIARDEAIMKEKEAAKQTPVHEASILTIEGVAKRGAIRAATIGLGEADERLQRS
jgi:hypothetical protein